mmetsp:Transcript_3022/g.9899  ORF Transcript_3022/g.9899 Transcript_3022/m.9899 type:complete len:114 (+) Transcript_3022:1804-2145(+)
MCPSCIPTHFHSFVCFFLLLLLLHFLFTVPIRIVDDVEVVARPGEAMVEDLCLAVHLASLRSSVLSLQRAEVPSAVAAEVVALLPGVAAVSAASDQTPRRFARLSLREHADVP